MRALDLFTGYGGITLALKDYVRPIAYVEIEEYAQKIIASRMADGSLPRAPILADVKNIEGKIGDCDIIYGGFPCQDISVAGNGKGLAGERSGLFFEIIRLTKEIRPTFVFLENVPAIRTRGLEQVIKEFTQIGYDCRWTCISAASVGAPHKRERWFLLANTNSSRQVQNSSQSEKRNGYFEPTWSSENVANSKRDKSGEQCGWSERKSREDSSNYMDSSWWSSEPDLGRVAHGTSFGVDRIKALGNGVVPLQVKTAFELLMGLNYKKSMEIK